MPRPPCEVPEDVWIEIFKYITVRQDAHNFSLTCRVARDATLPLLFRTLSFDAMRHKRSAWQSFLRNSSQRADSLLSHPHLLVHVLEVHVHFRGSVRGNLWRNAIDKISMTISALPRIRKLSLQKCTITPALHDVIYGKASLRSLEVHEAVVFTLLHPRPVVGLTALSYRDRSNMSPPWSIQLLDSCLSTLISLDIDYSEVYRHFIARIISGSQPFALRSLALDVSDPGDINICKLAVMCPELRTLRVPRLPECIFPDHALPNLELVEAPFPVLTALIPGRRIHTVNLTTSSNPMSRGDATLLRAGNAPVRHLSITTYAVLDGGIELLATAFEDLLSLSWTAEVLFPSHHNFESVLDSVTGSLSKWSQLQTYRIYSAKSLTPYLSKKYSQFPIAPGGDPSNRGHPSLTEFHFLSNFAWLWFPGEGWTLREVNGPQGTVQS